MPGLASTMRSPRVKSQGHSWTQPPHRPQSLQLLPGVQPPGPPATAMGSPRPPSNPPTRQDIDGLLQVFEVPLDAAQAIPQFIGRPVQLLAADRGALLQELTPALVQPAGCVHRLLHLAAGRGTAGASGGRPPLRPQTSGGAQRTPTSSGVPLPLGHRVIPTRAPPDRLAPCGPHPSTGWQGPEHPLPAPIAVTHPRTTKNGSSRDMSPPPVGDRAPSPPGLESWFPRGGGERATTPAPVT